MLERYVNDEFKAADHDFSAGIHFLGVIHSLILIFFDQISLQCISSSRFSFISFFSVICVSLVFWGDLTNGGGTMKGNGNKQSLD